MSLVIHIQSKNGLDDNNSLQMHRALTPKDSTDDNYIQYNTRGRGRGWKIAFSITGID